LGHEFRPRAYGVDSVEKGAVWRCFNKFVQTAPCNTHRTMGVPNEAGHSKQIHSTSTTTPQEYTKWK
jgi:hypothetical protein